MHTSYSIDDPKFRTNILTYVQYYSVSKKLTTV